MSLTIAIILLAFGLAILCIRTRNTLLAADGLSRISSRARPAALRLGYSYNPRQNPITQINDEKIAAATLAAAFIALDGSATSQHQSTATSELRAAYGLNEEDGADLLTLGQWMAGSCKTPESAIQLVLQRLHHFADHSIFDAVQQIFHGIVSNDSKTLSDKQSNAISAVKEFQSLFRKNILAQS